MKASQDDQPPRKGKGSRRIVRIDYTDTEAQRVSVAGAFNGWNPRRGVMDAKGDGQWSVELSLRTGIYEYQLVVDGRWIADPLAEHAIWRDDGRKKSLLVVDGESS